MEKSRSRSPRWKPRPPLPQRSPERNRHRPFQDYFHNDDEFHRDSRRFKHWEDEPHRQNNSRTESYSHFNDNLFEQGSFDTNPRRSPFESINRLNRNYSPERRGESNRRFPPKDPVYRENTRNFHNHRNHERNVNNNNIHNNGFKAARREDNFHRPHNRDHKDWHESDAHWNQHDPANQYLSPHRRRPDEHERKSFPKRYPEEDYREHEPAHKRAREAERHDFRPPLKSSHWKDDHPERPYHAKDWSKNIDPTPFVQEKRSGALNKIEYDYSHRSATCVYTEPTLEDEHEERHNHAERHHRHQERKMEYTRTSQHHKTLDNGNRERRKPERSAEPLSKYSLKKHDDNPVSKTDIDKHASHKHMEKTRKEGDYQRRNKDEYQKDLISPLHLRSQSPKNPDPKGVKKISTEKESIVVNLALKNSSDKYRQLQEQRNKPKQVSPPSNTTQGQENSEDKQILVCDMQERSNSTSTDRQLSHDLVAFAGKEKFHPVFEHLESSLQGGTNAPNSEFTQEIITIIHEVKANHFRSTGLSLHERFTKLQAESNKQELNLNNPTPQTNPEIHRRIDISLEELQSKSLYKPVDVAAESHRVIEDPNDLRHDIERRRKQRLHSEQNGTTDTGYGDSDASSRCYALPHQETGAFQSSSRVSWPPFRMSTGKPAVRDAYYRGTSNQYYASQNNIEDTEEIRKPYKGWGNPAARI